MKHLTRVVEIARKYGYRPMMWSDMFFRLANNGEYYSNGKRIEQEIINKVPKDVSLIYWDYYTEDESKYNAMMQSHNEFGRKVVFAGGAWKWVGFTPQNEYSMKLAEVAGKACINNEIKDVLITCWGDNGAEASLLSVMPTLNYWAEICWATNNMKWCSKRFEVCCNISYEDFIKIDEPLYIPGNPSPGEMGVNPTKYLLYQDILMGMIDYENIEDNVSEHFRRCGNMLTDIANDNQNWYKIFKAQAELCYLLEIKATIGIRLRDAYKKDNKDILIVIAKKLIPEMINRLEKFQNAYHDQWYAENKPFGLEVFDIRTGGLKERALTAAKRINAYLMGETQEIEELDVEILPFAIRVFAGNPLSSVHWEKISTPAALFWM